MAEFSPHSGSITNGEHILPLRIYYEDTDAAAIVYHANYLKYMERGRSDMLRLMGIDQADMLKFQHPDDVGFVIIRSEVDYIKPALLDDEITVHTKVTTIGRASLTMAQQVRRSGQILAQAVIRIAALNKAGKPARLPKQIVNKLMEKQG
ncbi:MAG: tol-pal system-associated acyl-CoA thioesterase [Alphaproteobacteria bacterium]|nr:tol-pal system-associated acyl-CoA thioesterase [Alphaproteobacteria bacterium]